MNLKFHHLGLATRNINKTLETMSPIGTLKILSAPVEDVGQRVKVQMIEWNGEIFELIEGTDEDNPIRRILEKGLSLYHVCYITENISDAVNKFVEEGWILISPMKPAELFGGQLIAFLYNKAVGIIELLGEDG